MRIVPGRRQSLARRRPSVPCAPYRGRFVRCGAATLAALATLVATPVLAGAHALLVSTNPGVNQVLGTAPGVVALEFSESLNPRLSSAAVVDPSLHRWPGQATTGGEIRIPLQTNVQGVYEVDWNSVSFDDGHHATGSFRFGVRVSAISLVGRAAGASNQPSAVDLLIGAAKWIEALALIAVVGQLLVALLAARAPVLTWVRPRLSVAVLALSAGMVVVWGEASVATGGHSLPAFAAYLTTGVTGLARLGRLGFELLIVIAAARSWRSLLVWVGAALAGVAASGHAANVQPAWWGILADMLHLAAAGLWAGGILALAAQRPPGGWRSADARVLLVRFTPPALAAFGITVAAGVIQATQQIGSWAALTGSTYGQVLMAKIVLVGLMLPLSALAWRLRRPRLRLEAALAVGVVAAAALLAAFPVPPTEAAQRLAARATGSNAGLPAAGDLTLGGVAGSVLVGLSLEPGRPGPNRVIVYLLPIQGNAAAAGLTANISTGKAVTPLTRCGLTCHQATLKLRGGESLAVDVLGPGGGRATFLVPSLPAASGAALIARMQMSMHKLHAYQVSESLSSGLSTILSTYSAEAPNRTTWSISGTSQTIYIGTTQYSRDSPGQPWRVGSGLAENTVPSFVWDYFAPLTDARVVGLDTIDGIPTTEVSAFGNKQSTAIWFHFWIDASGLVRRAQMTAPGHFMIDTYTGFNRTLDIVAPVGA